MKVYCGGSCSVAALCLLTWVLLGENPSPTEAAGPKSPQDELKTFRVAPGFRVELVACEPQVVDPVALAFDEDGRLFVAEMRGYPNDGYGTGKISSGCIKLLEDRDGDGFYETATEWATGLRFPTSVMPWNKALLVANAPELILLKDMDGTNGRANLKRVLYTGFGTDNIQQLLNSLQWGLDNWVHACNGASGGQITSAEKPSMPPVSLGNRGIRFHPEVFGSLEPMSGGGQFGLTSDAWQHWFTATNSQHLRQIVLPDHYLRRNPGQAAPNPTVDIPEHGPACKVFRISPFEAWRVERTARRAGGSDAARFPKTELVPGGFVTSACSPLVYEADRFPAEYHGSVFVCEPANNLVLRDKLEDNGSIFRARRADPEREFFASTDNWCRPVNLTLGPDGAIYLVDFYREVIETPRSLPDDMKPKLALKSQERGRIWRIVPDDHVRGRPPRLSAASSADLVPLLAEPNLWWRLTSQRLLIERQDKSPVPLIKDLFRKVKFAPGRAHALWTLHGLRSLDDQLIIAALHDESAGVREQALRMAEARLDRSEDVRKAALALAADPAARARLQAAFSLGESSHAEAADALGRLLRQNTADPWITAAAFSSIRGNAAGLLEAWLTPTGTGKGVGILPSHETRQTVVRLAALVGATGNDAQVERMVKLIAAPESIAWRIDLLSGFGQGLQNTPRPLHRLWRQPPERLKEPLARLREVFDEAAAIAASPKPPLDQRLEAARLLAFGPYDVVKPALQKLLAPQQPDALQIAAVYSVALHDDEGLPGILIGAWATASPAVRREIQEALFARPSRLPALLAAIEAKTIRPQQIDATRLAQLRNVRDPKLRERARNLLAGATDPDRQKAIDNYKEALSLSGDGERGRAVFRKTCSNCHRLESVGTEVGPDLLSAVRDKTAEQLLVSILDPSREVDRRFTNYVLETKSGRTVTGLIASETATSVTVRRAEGAEETILRTQIEAIADSGKSLMPDGLETQLSKQDVADVIAYLRHFR
jgi:putative membrane-bound dehydrogenase-like protein